MKRLLFIDFETQSEIDIKAGSYRYVQGLYFKPVCMAYSFLDELDVHTWTPDMPFPLEIATGSTLVAFNMEFEYNVLHSKWFEYNGYDTSGIKVSDFVDVQALGLTFGFPASLDKLAKALQVHHQKDAKGTRLINKLCVIKKGKVPTLESHTKDFEELYDYCRKDVLATKACYDMMVKKTLSPIEQQVFEHTLLQNQRGLPIDIDAVRTIYRKVEAYKDVCNKELAKVTNGVVTKGTQVKRITDYLKSIHPFITSLGKDKIEEYLKHPSLKSHAKEILELRQATSHSSTAKYKRIMQMIEDDNRVRGNLGYHVGHTGRFAGRGFQAHNLPRAKFDDPEKVIQQFMEWPLHGLMEEYGNVGAAASKLIRPMIKAPPGKMLMVADYKSVENVALHWIANDQQTMQDFRDDLDQYKTYAARRFNVHYDDVTDKMRTYAKPCVLGLGFGGGEFALMRVADGYGIKLSEQAAINDKQFYRRTFPMIPTLWYSVNDAVIKAVQDETITEVKTGTVTLRFIKRGTYLFTILPSGRFISYPAPTIQLDSKYGNPCMTYMGLETNQWRRLGDQHRVVNGIPTPDMPIHGGRLVENIVQATARDWLVFGLLEAERRGFKVLLSVHDEGMAEVEETATGSNLDYFIDALCTVPDWAPDVPLKAEGYIAKRYKKD